MFNERDIATENYVHNTLFVIHVGKFCDTSRVKLNSGVIHMSAFDRWLLHQNQSKSDEINSFEWSDKGRSG